MHVTPRKPSKPGQSSPNSKDKDAQISKETKQLSQKADILTLENESLRKELRGYHWYCNEI